LTARMRLAYVLYRSAVLNFWPNGPWYPRPPIDPLDRAKHTSVSTVA